MRIEMLSKIKAQSPKAMLAMAVLLPISAVDVLHAQSGQPVNPPVAMPLDSPQTAVEQYQAAQKIANAHLAKADDLDFNVFSNQQWDRFQISHARDIKVYWPDSHVEVGLEKHIESLKYFFTYAPDTRIKYHPVRLGVGEWVSWIGVMQGTFTKPMKMPDGRVIQPTGKAFSLPMCTVGHWKNGTMDAEYLFWDTGLYYRELGVQ
jgi:hypothetical protein